MDILTHTLSGLAAGALVAGFYNNRGGEPKGPARKRSGDGAVCDTPAGAINGLIGSTNARCSRRYISSTYICSTYTCSAATIAAGGLGGALPDIDAISLWSRFDATIGNFFGLSHSGTVIYSGKFWYSHHGFFHSLAAALLIAAIIISADYLIRVRRRSATFGGYIRRRQPAIIGFVSGFVIHLLEDMATPASAWGGVRFFWPLKTYLGGTGDIWWWNNYDIFLIAAGVFVVCVIVLVLRRFMRFGAKCLIAAVFASGCILCAVQIKSRDCDYAFTGHTDKYNTFETASKRQQREILGNKVYNAMEWLDRKLPIYF